MAFSIVKGNSYFVEILQYVASFVKSANISLEILCVKKARFLEKIINIVEL